MIQVIEAIEYASVFGYRPLLLDLYLPPAGGATPPAVLFLHGGGWALGDRKLTAPAFGTWSPGFFERLAAAGFAVASADYRLSGEAVYPAQLHDAKAAVRWLRRHAAGYGFDGERIVAWGTSAGAHLAALVGLTGDSPDPAAEGEAGDGGPAGGPPGRPQAPAGPPVSSSVAAVIVWYGPADLVALAAETEGIMEHDSEQSPEGRLLGGRVSANPALAKAASPLAYVHPGAPPFQLKHGTADRGVPVGQSQALATALRAAGVPVEAEWVDGGDHMWEGVPAAKVTEIFDSSVEFARRQTA
jgi:acetyl esterase/lipase